MLASPLQVWSAMPDTNTEDAEGCLQVWDHDHILRNDFLGQVSHELPAGLVHLQAHGAHQH